MICALVVAGAIMVFLYAYPHTARVGAIMLLVGLVFGFAAFYKKRASLRCHEHGVCKTGLTRETKLRYADVETFTYSATRHFLNGVYNGTTLAMAFTPRPEAGSEGISYNTSLTGMDDELENLREQISNVIGERMARELSWGRQVQWTPNLRLLPEGVEYRPVGFLGRKDPLVIPYDTISNFDLDDGTLHIWVHGQDKSMVQEQVSQPNFFPGLVVLSHLFSESSR